MSKLDDWNDEKYVIIFYTLWKCIQIIKKSLNCEWRKIVFINFSKKNIFALFGHLFCLVMLKLNTSKVENSTIGHRNHSTFQSLPPLEHIKLWGTLTTSQSRLVDLLILELMRDNLGLFFWLAWKWFYVWFFY